MSAVKLGPGAQRGLAAGTRPDRWGLGVDMADFATEANRQSLVCLQIEHRDAVDNIDGIVGVEGVDVVFVGPSDLSQSLGFPGDPKAAPVAGAINSVLARVRQARQIPGMPAMATNLPDVMASGCRYIYTHLPRLIGSGASEFLTIAGR